MNHIHVYTLARPSRSIQHAFGTQAVPLTELQSMCLELGGDPDLQSIDLSGNMLGVVQTEDGRAPLRPPDGTSLLP